MSRSRHLKHLGLLTLIAGAGLGSLAAPASASTAQIVDVVTPPYCKYVIPPDTCGPGSSTALVYRGGPEANRVTLAGGAAEVRISDPRAVIRPGRGCSRVSRHRVSCSVPEGVFVSTGRGADRVRSRLPLLLATGFIASGGPGNDVLVGGPHTDALYGGQGADVLRGRDGGDRLYDAAPLRVLRGGDPSPFGVVPQLTAPGRGRDSYDGGAGDDSVSYEGRFDSVKLDLAASAAVAGARGERDSVRGVESASGGGGDDRLAGDQRGNRLDGGEGDDRIVARGGDDSIDGASGRNVIDAGPGNDHVDSTYRSTDLGPEQISCGSGSDYVGWIFPSDFVEGDCETIELNFLSDAAVFGGAVRLLLPLRAGAPTDVLSTTLRCYFQLHPSGCELRLELRVAGPATRDGTAPAPGTLLGFQSYTLSSGEERNVTLGLSPAGIETLRRHRALRVDLQATEGSLPTHGFQTVLRSP